jgi:NAD(P)-dependent dehydrogenase (short-subunit alcohol dehydrogenase family)
MTIVAALELKRSGVTVNAIAPRAETRMTQGLIEQTEEEIERRNPSYASSLVTWLASPESSDITGRLGSSLRGAGRHAARCQHGRDAGRSRQPRQGDPSHLPELANADAFQS